MTELELRSNLVAIAKAWYGCREADNTHKPIIDFYNTIKPLPRGYKVKYTDEWCATYVSAVFHKAGLLSIAPAECSCSKMIEKHKALGTWVEDDAYVPAPGDIIMYDWQDSGVGDNTSAPDHVGIVATVDGNNMTIIEGNKGEAVAYRTLKVNGLYIRGYCVPNYAKMATASSGSTAKPEEVEETVFRVGDIVNFTGTTHYTSSNSTSPKSCKPGKAKVTATWNGKHPYHLIKEPGGGSTVYGWVDAKDIQKI